MCFLEYPCRVRNTRVHRGRGRLHIRLGKFHVLISVRKAASPISWFSFSMLHRVSLIPCSYSSPNFFSCFITATSTLWGDSTEEPADAQTATLQNQKKFVRRVRRGFLSVCCSTSDVKRVGWTRAQHPPKKRANEFCSRCRQLHFKQVFKCCDVG